MSFSVEQAFAGREEIQALLKTPAGEAISHLASFWTWEFLDWLGNDQLNLSQSLPGLNFIMFLYCSPHLINIFQSHNQQLKTEVSRYKRKFSEAQVQATKVKITR